MDGLVSWWKFDEGHGVMAYDSNGRNHGSIYDLTWTHYLYHQYNSAQTYSVKLTVTDDGGLIDTMTQDITVSTP